MKRNSMKFYRKYKGLCSKILRNTEWKRLSFWVQADLKCVKELFYHTIFKFVYQVMANFFFPLVFFYSFDNFSLHFLNYSSHRQAILLCHCKEKLVLLSLVQPTEQNKTKNQTKTKPPPPKNPTPKPKPN